MNEAQVIALYSHAAGQGKTTVANHLVREHGFTKVSFAGPLKAMVAMFLRQGGIPIRDVALWMGPRKELQVPGFPEGTTVRKLCRTLGVEWGRKNIADTLWISMALRSVNELVTDRKSVVIDDLRFHNEYHSIMAGGGQVWRIQREDIPTNVHDGHSEGQLEKEYFDVRLMNRETTANLKAKVSASILIPDAIRRTHGS